jgi:hypothetical protein
MVVIGNQLWPERSCCLDSWTFPSMLPCLDPVWQAWRAARRLSGFIRALAGSYQTGWWPELQVRREPRVPDPEPMGRRTAA